MNRQLSTSCPPAPGLGRQEGHTAAQTTPPSSGFGVAVLGAAEGEGSHRDALKDLDHLCLFLEDFGQGAEQCLLDGGGSERAVPLLCPALFELG